MGILEFFLAVNTATFTLCLKHNTLSPPVKLSKLRHTLESREAGVFSQSFFLLVYVCCNSQGNCKKLNTVILSTPPPTSGGGEIFIGVVRSLNVVLAIYLDLSFKRDFCCWLFVICFCFGRKCIAIALCF